MRIATIPAAAMLVVGLTVVSAFAGQHGNPTTLHGSSAKSSPHTQPATQGQAHVTPTTTTTAPHGNPHTTSVSTTPTTTTTSAHGNKHTVSSSPTPTTATTPTATTPTTPTTNTTPTTTREHGNKHTTSTTTTTATNPIASKISSHPQQAARIERMLPQGMTLATASNGFRNQGQFIAALHVSQNLNIPFTDLKQAMTGPNPMSLGQSIHKLRPSVDATTAESRARTQATTDLR
jgi:hypothetical protein